MSFANHWGKDNPHKVLILIILEVLYELIIINHLNFYNYVLILIILEVLYEC